MIKISTIIPVYNAEDYLRKTLDSVLSQSLTDIEVICVDDGSRDSSREIIEEYARQDSRVILLTQENQHAGVARNNGVNHARGEYIHFLDSDDYVLDFSYESIYNKVVKYNLDCLKFCALALDMGLNEYVENTFYNLTRLTAGDFNRLLDFEKKHDSSLIWEMSVTPWTGLYKRSFLLEKNVRFNNLYCVNDRSFSNKVYTNAERMMVSRDRVVVHRVNMKDSLIGTRHQHFDCHFRSMEIINSQLKNDGVSDYILDTVMNNEIRDLFAWFRKFTVTSPTENSNDILNDTKDFISRFDERYKRDLIERYNKIQVEIAKNEGNSAIQPTKGPVVKKVFYERCEKPKVSVVVPIFNVEDYLNEALYSLHTQTLQDIEFICVNDGSTDGSLAILKQYAAVDKRFVVLDGPNGGYGKAMNKGIDASRGEYIGILEPDDYVPPKMYEDLYKAASSNKLDIVKADFFRFKVNGKGEIKKTRFNLTGEASYYRKVIDTSEDINTFRFVMNTWSGIYNRDFLNKFRIRHNETPGASFQDNGFFFQTFVRAKRVMFINTPYYMNRRDNPNSSVYSTKKVFCMTDEYHYISDWMKQDDLINEKYKSIYYAKKFSNFIETFYRISGEFKKTYARHIYEEFLSIKDNEKYLEYFSDLHIKYLKDIFKNPDEFATKLRISVIIPVYNAEEYLSKCLDSLLLPGGVNFELICVNDGSTDRSLDILRDYEAKDSRVRVLTQENAGAGAARNAGMQIAKGEYYSFLDADDFFEPDMLRRSWERAYLDDNDITVFRSDQFHDDDDETFIGADYTIKRALLPKEMPFAGKEIPENIFSAFVGWAWDKLFHAEFVSRNNLKFQELRTTNDMLFVFSAIVKANSISYVNNILAHHRRNSSSLSVTREKSWWNFYEALKALKQQLIKWGEFKRFEQDYINYAMNFSFWQLNSLSGKPYHLLYDKLKNEWFSELGITSKKSWYFYDKALYADYSVMMMLDSNQYISFRLNRGVEYKNKFSKEQKSKNDANKKLKQSEEKFKKTDTKLKQTEKKFKEIESKLNKANALLKEYQRKISEFKDFEIGKYLKYKVTSKLTFGSARQRHLQKYNNLKRIYRDIKNSQ